jgi:hypothetical protein
MSPDTFAIGQFETQDDAETAGYTIQLSPEEAERLLPLTRAERRAMYEKRSGALMDQLAEKLEKARLPEKG